MAAAPTLTVKHVKLLADMLHMVCYPFLFFVLRKEKRTKIGVSLHSQILFFLALLTRYSDVVLETKSFEKALDFFTGKRSWSLAAVVDVYSKSSSYPIYVFLLKAFPLVFSLAIVLKIASSAHWEKRDTLSWLYLTAPCAVFASLLHQSVIHDMNPLAIAKTFSHLVEAVAVVPQLYLMATPNPPPEPEDDDEEEKRAKPKEDLSPCVEVHLMCRGLFRVLYVSTWALKAIHTAKESGQGLQSVLVVENLPHLAGILQMLLLADLFASFFRRHFRFVLAMFALLVTVLFHGGVKFMVQCSVLNIVLSIVFSLVMGGFLSINITFAFAVTQLVRAGVLYFKNPLEVLGLM
mmetsp:Transcript_39630/g.93858  ORF Transcript_39630/g.93858 Transcript_39630/m.93858 type:complete len:349 (+) Transcript_39630:61-1107(+)